jgi:hypothetical protein
MDNQLALDFSSKSPTSAMPSVNGGPSLKTSPAFSAVKEEETLLRWLEHYLGQRLTFQTVAGKTPVSHLGQKDWSSGPFWMRNTSEHRTSLAPSLSDEGVSLLSEILETGKVDPRYFLSPRACSGILRRAAKRGKKLPPQLKVALEDVGMTVKTPKT